MGKRRFGLGQVHTLIRNFKRAIAWKVPFGGQLTATGDIDGDTTLTAGQSGTYFNITDTTTDPLTITLPEATTDNIGWYCTIFLANSRAGKATVINTGAAADLFIGNSLVTQASSATAAHKVLFVPNVSSHNKMNMNGSSSGGVVTDTIKITIVAANRVLIDSMHLGIGNAIAPFTTQ